MKVGDVVRWESQAMGNTKRKEGTVLAFVQPGESALSHIPKGEKRSHVKFGDKSSIERILVAVPAGKDGCTVHYYAPRKSTVQAQLLESN